MEPSLSVRNGPKLQINIFQPKEGNTVNISDAQARDSYYLDRGTNIAYVYDSSGKLVRVKHSDADNKYIGTGSLVKALKALLLGIIISFALIIGSRYVDDLFPVLGDIGPYLSLFILVVGCILLVGSVLTFPKIKNEEEVRRIDEVMGMAPRLH